MNDRIIDRIRKCLALTTSDQPGEAANATAMVQKLLFRYKLTMADIETDEEEGPIGEQTVDLNNRRIEGHWKGNLIYAIARYNFCRVILSYDLHRAFVIGSKNEVEAVQEIYQWVVEQLIKEERIAWDRSCRRPLFRRSFFTGAVSEINNRLYRQWESLRKETAASTALVVSSEGALTEYVERQYGELRKGKHNGSSGSIRGYLAGRAAGARIELNSPRKLVVG